MIGPCCAAGASVVSGAGAGAAGARGEDGAAGAAGAAMTPLSVPEPMVCTDQPPIPFPMAPRMPEAALSESSMSAAVPKADSPRWLHLADS